MRYCLISTIPKTLLVLLLLSFFQIKKLSAEEYSVPHSGSPYLSLNELSNNEILHVPTGLKVSFDQMQDVISSSKVIYIGETHDNTEAHRVQLKIIKDLAQRFPGKVSVGMEMFRRSAQKDLDRWSKGKLPLNELKKLFRKNWGTGYELYKPIFDFISKNDTPLIGLKSSIKTEEIFRKNGFSNKKILPEIDFDDRYHRPFSMSIFGSHKTMENPYRMLLLWEETMAETVANFVKDPNNTDSKLIVLAGGFHVQYGFGIPKRAFRRIPHSYAIILPTVTELPPELKDREMDVQHVSIPLYSADYAWKVQYKVLPKNKMMLGVVLKNTENAVRIISVSSNSNADQAGLKDGDLLLAMEEIELTNIEDFIKGLKEYKIGDKVSFLVKRGEKEIKMEVHFREQKL
jgi:uncharacterized iron-regulated protein